MHLRPQVQSQVSGDGKGIFASEPWRVTVTIVHMTGVHTTGVVFLEYYSGRSVGIITKRMQCNV